MKTARKDIKEQMTNDFISNTVIKNAYNLEAGKSFEEQFSLVSIENILFEVVSFTVWLLGQFFIKHEQDVDLKLKQQKSGRLPWYQFMMLNYQDGFQLLTDSDQFDNSNATAEQILTSKKIKHCAVTNGDKNGVIIIKIAGEDSSGLLQPVEDSVKLGAQSYVDRIGWAGNEFRVINNQPDKLIPHYDIYIDPTVLDANGIDKQTGEKTVDNAIAEYMKELPFNGELVIQHLTDKLQKVRGVVIAEEKAVYSSWVAIDSNDNLYNAPTNIPVKRVPESGYYRIETLENIRYVVQY